MSNNELAEFLKSLVEYQKNINWYIAVIEKELRYLIEIKACEKENEVTANG